MKLKKNIWVSVCSIPYCFGAQAFEPVSEPLAEQKDLWYQEQVWRHPEMVSQTGTSFSVEFSAAPQVHRGDARVPVKIRLPPSTDHRSVARIEVDRGYWSGGGVKAQDQQSSADIQVEPGRDTLIYLHAPYESGLAKFRITMEDHVEERTVQWLPELRPWIKVGGVDVVLGQRKFSHGSLLPLVEDEEDFGDLGEVWDGNIKHKRKHYYGARAMFFIRGQVLKDYLLTASLDTSRHSSLERKTFDRIDENRLYPIYGDDSIQGHDAPTQHPLYVRLEKGLSYFLLSDINPARNESSAVLSDYNRQIAGAKYHHEEENLKANVWVGYDRLSRETLEIPGRGVSGPYAINRDDLNIGIAGSELVDIVVRDRNQPSMVVRSERQQAGADYFFEPFSGQLVFKRPIPSVDEFGNPISIRVSYEVEREDGQRFWTWGADAQYKPAHHIEVGASHAQDQNPMGHYSISGVNLSIKPTEHTRIQAEWAHSDQRQHHLDESIPVGKGQALRLDARYHHAGLSSNFLYQEGSRNFYNPSSVMGVTDQRTLRSWHQFQLDDIQRVRFGGSYTHRKRLDHRRSLIDVAYQRDLNPSKTLYAEAGFRYANEHGEEIQEAIDDCFSGYEAQDRPTFSQVSGLGRWPFSCYQPLSARKSRAIRGRLGWRHGPEQNLHLYIEGEQELQHLGYAAAIGADYRLSEWLRAYARHEYIYNENGIYGSHANAAQATLVGLDSTLWQGYKLFSEYRMKNILTGEDGQWANGVRKTWAVRPGWNTYGSAELLRTLKGKNSHAWALSWGNDWNLNDQTQGHTKVDYRTDHHQHSWLVGAGLKKRLTQDWSVSLSEYLYHVRSSEHGIGRRLQQRFQLGAAYRDHPRNVWNALARYEWKTDDDQHHKTYEDRGKRNVHMVLANIEAHPTRPLWLTGKIGAKHVNERFYRDRHRYSAYVLGGRATYDVNDRWDIGVLANQLWDRSERLHNVGVEGGYRVMDNLWLSVGYNFSGFKEKDLTEMDYTNKGFYFRVRFKF
jgi:hypothetical protein